MMTPLAIQPIPYQGSKRALAPRIAKLFPKKVKTLYEPFAGSAAICLYAASYNLAERFVIGDVFPELIELWRLILNEPESISSEYRAVWNEQFETGATHFNVVRSKYNEDRNPAHLLYLIARCVKNAVRFNRRGDFTQSVDKRRTGVNPDKLEVTIHFASSLLRGRTELFCGDFRDCITKASKTDLVYMDPPYQGTTYGADKRYAAQLDRSHIVECLADLNRRSVPYVLSYDGKTGDKEYAAKLPDTLNLAHLYIDAGRSSQATLAGRAEQTLESIYISHDVTIGMDCLPNYEKSSVVQHKLLL